MPESRLAPNLHLADLLIENFRGIQRLEIPRLGRVTLIAGKNAAGKTALLDAVRVYASGGRYARLRHLLESREEYASFTNEDNARFSEPDWSRLFYERRVPIVIGPVQQADARIAIRLTPLSDLNEEQAAVWQRMSGDDVIDVPLYVLRVTYGAKERAYPLLWADAPSASAPVRYERDARRTDPYRMRRDDAAWSEMPCEYLETGLLNNQDLSSRWDRIVLTETESLPLQALSFILGNEVANAAAVEIKALDRQRCGRQIMVKFRSHPHPMPLKSLGKGALRLFDMALALAASRNGLLLIDEAENGLHYSLQPEFWSMMLETAHKNNVQILATTHSWDCIRGFAQAALANPCAEGLLLRLDKAEQGLRALEYEEEDLEAAVEQGIEVR